MRIARSLALALTTSLALFGCSSDDPVLDPEVSEPGPSNPGEPGEPGEETVTLAGSYQIVTDIDLGSDAFASDDLIGILQGIKDAPITTLILAGAEDLGISPTILASIESFLGGALPEGFSNSLDNLANNIDEALGSFELVSTLEVTSGDGRYAASHTVTGITVSFAGIDTFVDVTEETSSSSAVVEYLGSSITVSEHELPVPVGAAMSAILDNEIAKSIAPSATSLGEALAIAADCESMSDWAIVGGVSLQSVCIAGTSKLADNLAKALDKLDTFDIDMNLTGQAKVSDDDADGTFDGLDGAWVNGGDSLPFIGDRM
ncbi:MAG: hypothetical protein KJO07_06865 [Deltaproteobacteria bacterium]|nr:hypothetical protein [Deltaproteobacteria bacterium]